MHSDTVFHYCDNFESVNRHYFVDSGNRFCEIEVLGEVVTDGDVYGSDHIKILREITGEELKEFIGLTNGNSGIFNDGLRNSGKCNCGKFNSGNGNSGDWNSLNSNVGNFNTGNMNVGNYNSGNKNIGDYNSGCKNIGRYNCGDDNKGNRNTGYNNIGDYNSGDFNKGNANTGCFNTTNEKIRLFNKESQWTLDDWNASEASRILSGFPKQMVEWVHDIYMTEEEKALHPTYKTTGGYLKELDVYESRQAYWDSLTEVEKDAVKSLPNFDAEIFKECTGIDVSR